MMKLYQAFATDLNHLLNGARAVRITVSGYMPLSVEEIGSSGDGDRLVSLCHYGEQNGDLMRDPDIVFLFHNFPDGMAAEPVSFRNDYLGIVQDVYRYDETGRRTHVVPSLKQELKEFAESWFVNLKDQGFFAATAVRQILSP
ncbi:DUF6908 domain-containing protein [Candidatus Nitrospira nitrificans]|uniref:DUF6908 domain-containing protein n=1 Tax=Candidatus Nitrospira nitrificans TaxID=1742973 RepID=A0A0S4LLI9_9BACT|nr:hypothetical protein [Candidatus Nitrospira nitrificans]CUS37790.1 hypothetical protein COMA2_40027 [Candidatus Nitrospira nitrificans]